MTSTPSAIGPVTLTEVTVMADTLASMAQRLDPDALPDTEIAGVISQLGRAVRTVDGMFTLTARRAEETDAHRASGHRSAADLVADATGTTSRTAKARLRTSVQLTDQPQVRDAVAGGKLSVGQAQIVADTAAADPDATDSLLTTAATTDVHGLRKEAQRIRRDADPDPGATRRRHYLSRHFRSWTDEDGRWNAAMTGPADLGARIEAAIRAEHDAVFKTAHAQDRREEDGCYRFDAVLALLEAGAETEPVSPASEADDEPAEQPPTVPAADTTRTPSDSAVDPPDTGEPERPPHPADTNHPPDQQPTDQRPTDQTSHHTPGPRGPARQPRRTPRTGRQTQVIIRVDAPALARGTVEQGEVCDIAGIGPVPLAALKAQIPHAHLAYVITNARGTAVAHLGRQVTAHQRTAMLARGYQCEVPGCTTTHLLEIDHTIDWAISRQTRLDLLAWLCAYHHSAKTDRGYQLLGPPGARRWVHPDGHTLTTDLAA